MSNWNHMCFNWNLCIFTFAACYSWTFFMMCVLHLIRVSDSRKYNIFILYFSMQKQENIRLTTHFKKKSMEAMEDF